MCAGPKPIGARKANLSPEVLPFAQEVALSEQVRMAPSCLAFHTPTAQASGGHDAQGWEWPVAWSSSLTDRTCLWCRAMRCSRGRRAAPSRAL